MVIFALEIERQLIIELHFLTETMEFNLFHNKQNKNKKLNHQTWQNCNIRRDHVLRLSPEGNDRFIQSESLRIIPGGGEANVAVSLANYGS